MFLLILISLISFINSKRLFVYEHFRHGARGPCDGLDENNLDFLKIKWETLGELSPTGMRMHYLLGYRNRLRYKDFLSAQYDPREMLIISTDVNRTIHSAISNLQGMYPPSTGPTLTQTQIRNAKPPNDITDIDDQITQLGTLALPNQMQTIPIHTFYQANNDFLLHEIGNCKAVLQMRNENKKKAKITAAAESFNQHHFEKLNKYYHYTNPNQLLNWTYVEYWCDHFIADYTEDRDLSPLIEVGLKPEEMANDCHNVLFLHLYEVVFGDPDETIATMAMSRPMRKILNYMDKRIQLDQKGTPDAKDYLAPKFIIHSAHDTTMGGLIVFLNKAFGINTLSEFNPKYASNMYLELMKKDTDLKREMSDYYVDYYFEDKLIKTIPYQSFKDIIKLFWSDKQIDDYCEFNHSDNNSTTPHWIAIGFLIAIITGLTIAVVVIGCLINKRHSVDILLSKEERTSD